MRAKVSKRLVIDASVARSAGGEAAVFPLSKQCRDFLRATLDICHKAVLTGPVREEWNKHESSFARQWRATMMSRKKLLLESPDEDVSLRTAIETAATTKRGREAMLKDAHLIEAARAFDHTVVSVDDAARGLFAEASAKVRPLQGIVWVNPGDAEEESAKWLEDGAPAEKHRQLKARRGMG